MEGRLSEKAADPGAATPLHDRFAAGLRALLRHKLPGADIETGVFYVLVTVARALREGRIQNEKELLAQVRLTANNFVKEAKTIKLTFPSRTESQARHTFEQMEPTIREILIRFYRLGQTNQQICEAMSVSAEVVRRAKRSGRELLFPKSHAAKAAK